METRAGVWNIKTELAHPTGGADLEGDEAHAWKIQSLATERLVIQSVVLEPAASASHKNLSEMETLRPEGTLTKSESAFHRIPNDLYTNEV